LIKIKVEKPKLEVLKHLICTKQFMLYVGNELKDELTIWNPRNKSMKPNKDLVLMGKDQPKGLFTHVGTSCGSRFAWQLTFKDGMQCHS
jgi:hypothetical protein